MFPRRWRSCKTGMELSSSNTSIIHKERLIKYQHILYVVMHILHPISNVQMFFRCKSKIHPLDELPWQRGAGGIESSNVKAQAVLGILLSRKVDVNLPWVGALAGAGNEAGAAVAVESENANAVFLDGGLFWSALDVIKKREFSRYYSVGEAAIRDRAGREDALHVRLGEGEGAVWRNEDVLSTGDVGVLSKIVPISYGVFFE